MDALWFFHAPKDVGMGSDGLLRPQLLAGVPPLARFGSTSRRAEGHGGGARRVNEEPRAEEQRAMRRVFLSSGHRCHRSPDSGRGEIRPRAAASKTPCSWRLRAPAAGARARRDGRLPGAPHGASVRRRLRMQASGAEQLECDGHLRSSAPGRRISSPGRRSSSVW
jgi:hypothetical protein